MYSVIKDFAGPVATVIAAAAASYVAYHFSRAQLDATNKRLVLDLFDRRWEVVQELRVAISEMRAPLSSRKNCWSGDGLGSD